MTRGGATRRWHLAGFITVGLASFAVDLALSWGLSRGLGLSPFLARVPAVAVAMVVGWLANRRLTFHVEQPPDLAEFLRYAGASGAAVAINYAIYAAILTLWPATALGAAVFAGSAAAAGASYLGYRFFAFRPRA